LLPVTGKGSSGCAIADRILVVVPLRNVGTAENNTSPKAAINEAFLNLDLASF
jgi:hypothetical protein